MTSRPTHYAVLVLIFMAALAAAPPLTAQPAEQPLVSLAPAGSPPRPMQLTTEEYGTTGGRFKFLWQNDSWFSTSDRFYTNGIAIGWAMPDGEWSHFIRDQLTWLPFRPDVPTATSTEFSLRQDMFTPEDFTNPALVVNDAPYAGWLHLDTTHHILMIDADDVQRRDRLDSWEIQLGVVGPSSQAERAQIQVHEAVGAEAPEGWRHQLKDEPGLVLGYRREFRTYYNEDILAPFENDFKAHWGVRVGNVDTSVRLGGVVRVGINLPRHFDTAIRPLGPKKDQQRLYLHAGLEGRWVARDIFLDGNTWRDSHSVDRNHLVADFHVGMTWEWGDCARISVSEFHVTPRFDSPSQDGDLSRFTSVVVELLF